MIANEDAHLQRNAIGVSHIVFFVVAAAAPLTTVVGVSPAAFAFGNGAGVPGTFVLVGLLYLLFSVGYTTMSRFVGNVVGFYSYIAIGLRRPIGIAGAFMALISYLAIIVAVNGLFGFFLKDIVEQAGGPVLHWFVYSVVLAALVFPCAVRGVEFSGRVLGVCMIAEILILTLFGLSVLLGSQGPEAAGFADFGPKAIFTPGLGVSLVFVVTSFIGFEATAVFGEEAKDPKRTIPRATYLAVLIIAVFYAFTTWSVALHYGPARISEVATANTASMYLDAVRARLGTSAAIAMQVLLIASLFACALSFQSTASRYLFAMAREGLIWRRLSQTHPRHRSPYWAASAQAIVTLAATAAFALLGQDPYAVVFAWMGTVASVGILATQVLVSLAVIGFFRHRAQAAGLWPRLVAPALSSAGLGGCLVLMLANVSLISCSDSMVASGLPLVIPIVGALGLLFAGWLKSARPAIYDGLGRISAEPSYR